MLFDESLRRALVGRFHDPPQDSACDGFRVNLTHLGDVDEWNACVVSGLFRN